MRYSWSSDSDRVDESNDKDQESLDGVHDQTTSIDDSILPSVPDQPESEIGVQNTSQNDTERDNTVQQSAHDHLSDSRRPSRSSKGKRSRCRYELETEKITKKKT